jgi:hypothetical protein
MAWKWAAMMHQSKLLVMVFPRGVKARQKGWHLGIFQREYTGIFSTRAAYFTSFVDEEA